MPTSGFFTVTMQRPGPLCNQQLQLMEHVFILLRFYAARNRTHHINRGWIPILALVAACVLAYPAATKGPGLRGGLILPSGLCFGSKFTPRTEIDLGKRFPNRPHYYAERNHQGLGNRLLRRAPPPVRGDTDVQRRVRLGELLSFYHREAA